MRDIIEVELKAKHSKLSDNDVREIAINADFLISKMVKERLKYKPQG